MRGPETWDELIEYLFQNGAGRKGLRLILVEEDYSGAAQVINARDLGGWSKEAIRNVVHGVLEAQKIHV